MIDISFTLEHCIAIAFLKPHRLSRIECWGGWSKESLEEWGLLAKLSTAGMMSTMGQWWSMEIAAGMAGVLGTISLAAHSCISNLLFFVFPFACAHSPCMFRANAAC